MDESRLRRKPVKTGLRAYLSWIFLGGLGVHRFYLGRKRTGLAILCYTLVTTAIDFYIFDHFPNVSIEAKEAFSNTTIGILWIVLIIDLFLIRRWLEEHNTHQKIDSVFE